MDGGFAETALMGALTSGGMALASGKNPLNAALLGGLTGGAAGGIGNLANGANFFASPALEGGAGISGLFSSPTASTATNIASSAAPTATQSVTNAMVDSAGNAITPLASGAENTIGADMVQNAAGTYVNPDYAYITNAGEQAGTTALANAGTTAAKPGILGGLNDTWKGLSPFEKAGAAGIGAYGLTKFMQPPKLLDPNIGKQSNDHPLASLSPDFQGNFPVASIYHPTYAAQGGTMRSYAEGGIAALANGGQGISSQGMGNNMGYPQGQQDHTQYATPTQMPTSASVIDSGYEQKTNPYSGEPTGFADGGIATNPMIQSLQPGQNSMLPWQMGGQNQGYQGMGSWQNANGNYGMGTMFGRQLQPKVDPASSISPDFQAAQATPQVYTPHYAEGGIAGFSLGGYAAGGNPRLLKGPGDGISDSIPATIGGKQPARLADGEFVLPARIVSELGNGSTDAGAKALYAMMDRVQNGRKKSIGKNKIATNTNPTKHLPV